MAYIRNRGSTGRILAGTRGNVRGGLQLDACRGYGASNPSCPEQDNQRRDI